MNPVPITASQWEAIGRLLFDLAALAFLLTIFALALLAGHAVIPSLGTTHDLPAGLSRIRPLLYLLALAALGGAVFFGAQALDLFPVIVEVYPRFFI